MLTYPNIDPVIFTLGPFAIRWYSLSYIAGILLGWLYISYIESKTKMRLFRSKSSLENKKQAKLDDFVFFVTIGLIVGGRIGYCIFYNFSYYIAHPIEILFIWQGGMSFHGGMIGAFLGALLFASQNNIHIVPLLDLAAAAAPIGIFFGRIANFINGELYGRVTDSYFGMIFPDGGSLPRHPSQLYEAFLEGFLLFTIIFIMIFILKLREKPGMIIGAFGIFYGLFRLFIEYFREPDLQIGYLFNMVTMGQLLSLPMILIGIIMIIFACRNRWRYTIDPKTSN